MGVAAVVLVWVPLVLGLEHFATFRQECLLGLATWVLLLILLRREEPATRAQVAVVVAFAAGIEYTFSGLLHVYVYRLHDIPLYVPPGHGLVYLAALSVGRDQWVRAHGRALVRTTLLVGGGYASWGLLLSGRTDVLGALWFGCLVYFLLRGRQPLVYVGAFVVVTWLELLGTHLGAWRWSPRSPTGIIPIGNPPSGAPGGYGFFDAAALVLGPRVLAGATRLRSRAVTLTPRWWSGTGAAPAARTPR